MNNHKMVHLPGIPTVPKRFYKFSFYSTSVTVLPKLLKILLKSNSNPTIKWALSQS